MTDEPQRVVGGYEVLEEIGRGGMAVVYLARQIELRRNVALKQVAISHDPAFAARFLTESRLTGSLSHPNIVTVHDYVEHGGTAYIAMEYLPRGSLRPWVGRLVLAQIIGVLEGLLAGLEHAGEVGIVHRDLKPENLMLSGDGRIKIADFGIAKALDAVTEGAFKTATGVTVGTPTYMAPEQAMATDIGPWTDLYSVGVIAYELLVGRLPFPPTETPMAILLHHLNDPIPPPLEINPALDPRLATWIEWLLEKDRHARPATAAEAWDVLEEHTFELLGPRWARAARLLEQPQRDHEGEYITVVDSDRDVPAGPDRSTVSSTPEPQAETPAEAPAAAEPAAVEQPVP
ncbi:MAG: serine/threonine protein kinase, partial [Solirubrobacterales bacterium]|nr:serine/threonine protein kinase [Solirubrobacterales bacterium]